ncbi:MAG: hypothetical protein ACP5RN_13495 [Armatimonadota bacterium]
MSARNVWFIGCGAVVFLVLMSAGILFLYWTAPPDVPVPPLSTPPNNAYPAYLQLVEKTRQLEASTSNVGTLSERAMQRGASTSDLRQLVAAYQPIRREYRKLRGKPSVVTDWDSMHATMQAGSVLRTWARVEAADIEVAFREGDHARAIDDLRTILLLTENIRRGGTFMRYLVGEAMIVIVTAVFSDGLEKLSPVECDRVVQVIREWEQVRVPFWQALEGEKRFTIAVCHAMHEGGERTARMYGAPPHAGPPRYAGRMFNLRAAAREAARLYDKAIAEAKKPLLQRRLPGVTPKHPLNQALLSTVFNRASDKSAISVARLRLLACAAAVRAYRLRHGHYPRTLAEAGIADLNKDPITGGEFVYHTGAKGFLLYSVGVDGKDDGGKRVVESRIFEARGDISPVRYAVPKASATTPPGPAVWLR